MSQTFRPPRTIRTQHHETPESFLDAAKDDEVRRIHSYLVAPTILKRVSGEGNTRTDDFRFLEVFGFNPINLLETSDKETTVAVLSAVGKNGVLHCFTHYGPDSGIPDFCKKAYGSPDETRMEEIPVVNGIAYNTGEHRFNVFRPNYNYGLDFGLIRPGGSAEGLFFGYMALSAFFKWGSETKLKQSYIQWQAAVSELDPGLTEHDLPILDDQRLYLKALFDGFDHYTATLDYQSQIRRR